MALKSITEAHVVKLTIIGKPYDFLLKLNMTLRDLLRNVLGLTSIKYMYHGVGACDCVL